MDVVWQIRLNIGVDDEGAPVASVLVSRPDGRSHQWHGQIGPGANWDFTTLDRAEWPGKLFVRVEPLEGAGGHEEHTPS